MQRERIYIRVSKELKEKAEKAATEYEMSLSNFIRWILIETIKDE